MTQNLLSRFFPDLSHALVQVFGAPGSGKTSLLLSLAREVAIQGTHIYFLDCPGKISFTRLTDILNTNKNLEKVTIFRPNDLKDLTYTIDDLDIFSLPPDSQILIDDPFSLYQPKSQKKQFGFKISKDLSRIFALISRIGKSLNRPIFVTNQVRGKEDEKIPYLARVTKRYVDYDVHLTRERGSNLIRGSIIRKKGDVTSNFRLAIVKEGVKLL